jgi:hypothetical protein
MERVNEKKKGNEGIYKKAGVCKSDIVQLKKKARIEKKKGRETPIDK